MEINEFFPRDGERRDIYCDNCGVWMNLVFDNFNEDVSGIRITIEEFPYLICPECGFRCFPEHSSSSIVDLHIRTLESGLDVFSSSRNKIHDNFRFTDVPFLYDPDDYFLIPGLQRPFDIGFLTPVFFNKAVLLKFQNHPIYRIRFASKTYGTIYGDEGFYISFGINRTGKVIMWLGDVASLPEREQYYLRSENVESDHDIGSEFYDGQIEVKFTELSAEDALLQARSNFLEFCLKEFGLEFEHLKKETLKSISEFNAPVLHSAKEMKDAMDLLNKIIIESLHPDHLKQTLSTLGEDPKSLGSLKRLELVFTNKFPKKDVHTLMAPFFVLYDLRVSLLHAQSEESNIVTMRTVCERLNLPVGSTPNVIYLKLIEQLTNTYTELARE